MGSISGVAGSSDAWASMRSQMQARMFAKADSNSDGGVDKTELASMLSDFSKITGQNLGTNTNDAFTSMDTSGDGTLSADELGKGMEKLMPPPSTMDFAQSRGGATGSSTGSDPVDALFSKLDSNGDGSLDKAELKTLVDQIKSDSGTDVSSKLDKLAKDNGATVSKDAFKAAIDREHPSESVSRTQSAAAVGSTKTSSSGDSTSYDSLDTNKDGTVSQFERLTGDLKASTQSKAGINDLAQTAQEMYEQFAHSLSQAQGGTLSAVA